VQSMCSNWYGVVKNFVEIISLPLGYLHIGTRGNSACLTNGTKSGPWETWCSEDDNGEESTMNQSFTSTNVSPTTFVDVKDWFIVLWLQQIQHHPHQGSDEQIIFMIPLHLWRLGSNVRVSLVQNCTHVAEKVEIIQECLLAVITFPHLRLEIYCKCLKAVRISHIKGTIGIWLMNCKCLVLTLWGISNVLR
jgi:hypothetical protein